MILDETAYGIIPLKRIDEKWHVLLVFSRHKFWGLPKGHPEGEETSLQAAERELFEETHLKVSRILTERKFTEKYQFEKGPNTVKKTTYYFLATVVGEIELQKNEILDSQWVPIDIAPNKVTYPETKKVLISAMPFIF